MNFRNGLALFVRCGGQRTWNVVSYHSPHSLTWSWILSASWSRPGFIRPRCEFRGRSHLLPGFGVGVGSIVHAYGYCDNGGWQWGLILLGACLSWQRQRPMYYRDIWRRERDERDGLADRVAANESL